MRSLVVWNAAVAAVFGAMYGALARRLAATKPAADEHAFWAVRTVYRFLLEVPDETKRDLSRALVPA